MPAIRGGKRIEWAEASEKARETEDSRIGSTDPTIRMAAQNTVICDTFQIGCNSELRDEL